MAAAMAPFSSTPCPCLLLHKLIRCLIRFSSILCKSISWPTSGSKPALSVDLVVVLDTQKDLWRCLQLGLWSSSDVAYSIIRAVRWGGAVCCRLLARIVCRSKRGIFCKWTTAVIYIIQGMVSKGGEGKGIFETQLWRFPFWVPSVRWPSKNLSTLASSWEK